MTEAVIVATARTPIGRAFKGSLKDIRPDDLTTQIVRAALDKVPELDPTSIDDLMLGCGLPGGEQGFNMARIVAVQLGLDTVPGTTITRYCSSSLQTTRMAYHAIKAGEGDVFVSAGVETVSRFVNGNSDDAKNENPLFDDAKNRTAKRAEAEGYRIGGKTGTAEKVVGGRYSTSALLTSFLAAFPTDAPEYVVLVMLDEPQRVPESSNQATAGVNAAPTAGKIVARIAPILGVPPRLENDQRKFDAKVLASY